MEHVSALETANTVTVPEAAEAEHAAGGVFSVTVSAAAAVAEGGAGVEGELLREGDEVGVDLVVVVVVAVEDG